MGGGSFPAAAPLIGGGGGGGAFGTGNGAAGVDSASLEGPGPVPSG